MGTGVRVADPYQAPTKLMTHHHHPTQEVAAVITTVIIVLVLLLLLLMIIIGHRCASLPPLTHLWMDQNIE